MGELATHSKTLAQYGIKDCCKIVLTADNAFGWKVPPVNPLNIHKVTIVGGTVQCNREQELKALFEEEKPPIVVAESTEKSEKEKIVT